MRISYSIYHGFGQEPDSNSSVNVAEPEKVGTTIEPVSYVPNQSGYS